MENAIHLPKDHCFLLAGQEIDQILTPLKRFGIVTLTYMRNYDDGHQIFMSNNSSWVEDYYREKLCGNFISGHPKQYNQKYLVVPNESPLVVHQMAREKYDEGNTFCLIKRYPTYTQFFFFAGRVGNKALTNFYISNIDLLETFAIYFEERTEKLIQQAEKNKILLPTAIYSENIPVLAQMPTDLDSIKTALKEMSLKKFQLKHKGVKITSREIDCVAAYQQGLTAKESALMMNISYRTVEKCFDSMSKKFNCYDKKDILRYLIQDGFPQNILTYATFKAKELKVGKTNS